MARVIKATSRYVNTRDKDFYLDLWEAPTIQPSIDDSKIEITSKYHLRPDRMAYDYYGTPRLWWIFAIVNKNELVDPINDFTAGTIINVPSRSRVEDEVL